MKISGGVVAALESDFLQGEIWTVFQKAAGLFHAKAGEILHHSRAGFFLVVIDGERKVFYNKRKRLDYI